MTQRHDFMLSAYRPEVEPPLGDWGIPIRSNARAAAYSVRVRAPGVEGVRPGVDERKLYAVVFGNGFEMNKA